MGPFDSIVPLRNLIGGQATFINQLLFANEVVSNFDSGPYGLLFFTYSRM